MRNNESKEIYEENTHRDIYNRLNKTELQVASLLSGAKVIGFIVLVFGGVAITGMFSLSNSINDNTKTLVEIKTILKAVENKAQMIDMNASRIRDLELSNK